MTEEEAKKKKEQEKARFAAYVEKLKTEKKFDAAKKVWVLKNDWAAKKSDDWFRECWRAIKASGLEFDGKHITLTERGVSYDYVAYKNKMLLAYPETKIDTGIVYDGDFFACGKESGVVSYVHNPKNPFDHKDADIKGAYCVIKNRRGDFIVTLSRDEVDKARAKAKTQTIWKEWYSDMVLKTVIRKAVKFHFDDIYQEMDDEDNKNYDMDKPEAEPAKDELPEALVNAVEGAETLTDLINIYDREYDKLSPVCKTKLIGILTPRKLELRAAAGQAATGAAQ